MAELSDEQKRDILENAKKAKINDINFTFLTGIINALLEASSYDGILNVTTDDEENNIFINNNDDVLIIIDAPNKTENEMTIKGEDLLNAIRPLFEDTTRIKYEVFYGVCKLGLTDYVLNSYLNDQDRSSKFDESLTLDEFWSDENIITLIEKGISGPFDNYSIRREEISISNLSLQGKDFTSFWPSNLVIENISLKDCALPNTMVCFNVELDNCTSNNKSLCVYCETAKIKSLTFTEEGNHIITISNEVGDNSSAIIDGVSGGNIRINSNVDKLSINNLSLDEKTFIGTDSENDSCHVYIGDNVKNLVKGFPIMSDTTEAIEISPQNEEYKHIMSSLESAQKADATICETYKKCLWPDVKFSYFVDKYNN